MTARKRTTKPEKARRAPRERPAERRSSRRQPKGVLTEEQSAELRASIDRAYKDNARHGRLLDDAGILRELGRTT